MENVENIENEDLPIRQQIEHEVEMIAEEDKVDFSKYEPYKESEQIAQEPFYYSIVAPKIFRANTPFTLNLTIHDTQEPISNEPVLVRVSIEDENDEDGYSVYSDVTMKVNVTEVISIPVGDIPVDRNYKLVIRGVSGVRIEREASLDLQTQTHFCLIQTNKAIYKPNDCVKFRVLVLDGELRAAPINQNELNITFTVNIFAQIFFGILFHFICIIIVTLPIFLSHLHTCQSQCYRDNSKLIISTISFVLFRFFMLIYFDCNFMSRIRDEISLNNLTK